MSTHNICFRGEIRKIFSGYPPLSRPMILSLFSQQIFLLLSCTVVMKNESKKSLVRHYSFISIFHTDL